MKEAFSVEGLFLNPYHSVANILFWLMCRYNICIYRVSQEEGTKLRESVPYVKIYRYNPKHLHPKLNGYEDNGQRKVWFLAGLRTIPCQLTALPMPALDWRVRLQKYRYRCSSKLPMHVMHSAWNS